MIRGLLLTSVVSCALRAQIAIPPPPMSEADDHVAAIIEGTPYKISDLEKIAKSLSPQLMNNFYQDKKSFIQQLAMLMTVAKQAEQRGLDKDFPHLQRLKYNRDVYLYQVMIGFKDIELPVSFEDQQKYYSERKAEFGEAKVKIIYLAFNNNPAPTTDPKAKKFPAEAEAEKKAAGLVKQLRAGADFAQLAKENSDDEAGREKGGEFPNIKPGDASIPPAIKMAVFALKPGEVADAVKQPNGFYIIRLEKIDIPEFVTVKDEIYKNLKNERIQAWLESVKNNLKIEFKDDTYLAEKAPRQ
jgi:peptidyl-prolyl cis-trans isomerase C